MNYDNKNMIFFNFGFRSKIIYDFGLDYVSVAILLHSITFQMVLVLNSVKILSLFNFKSSIDQYKSFGVPQKLSIYYPISVI